MKKEIFDKVEKLSSSAELDIVLNTLKKIDKEKSKKSSSIDSIYEEAVKQYGSVLKKLAE